MGQKEKAQCPAEWEAATGGAGWDAVRAGSTWKGELIYLFFLSRNSNWFPDLSVGGREGQPSVTLSFVVLASRGGAGVKNTRVFLPAGGDSLSPWQLSHIQN